MKPFRLTPDHYVFLGVPRAARWRLVPFVHCSKCGNEERLKGDIVRRAVQWVIRHEKTCVPVKRTSVPRSRRGRG